MLYEHVDLRSFDHVRAFFGVPRPARRSSIALVKHNEGKRAQWERIKTLAITIAPFDRKRSLGALPKALTRPGVGPLQLDRLRLTYEDEAESLLPLLNCFNPAEIALCRTGNALDRVDDRWLTSLPNWSNVTHITLGCPPDSSPTFAQRHAQSIRPAFPQATSARVLLPRSPIGSAIALTYLLNAIDQLCPNLQGAEICSWNESQASFIRKLVRDGLAVPDESRGKSASFYPIVVKLDGIDRWEAVDKGNT